MFPLINFHTKKNTYVLVYSQLVFTVFTCMCFMKSLLIVETYYHSLQISMSF